MENYLLILMVKPEITIPLVAEKNVSKVNPFI